MFALVVAGIDTAPLSDAGVFFGVEYNRNDQETNVLSEMRFVSKGVGVEAEEHVHTDWADSAMTLLLMMLKLAQIQRINQLTDHVMLASRAFNPCLLGSQYATSSSRFVLHP